MSSFFSVAKLAFSPTQTLNSIEHAVYAAKNFNTPHAEALLGHARLHMDQQYRSLEQQLQGLLNTVKDR